MRAASTHEGYEFYSRTMLRAFARGTHACEITRAQHHEHSQVAEGSLTCDSHQSRKGLARAC